VISLLGQALLLPLHVDRRQQTQNRCDPDDKHFLIRFCFVFFCFFHSRRCFYSSRFFYPIGCSVRLKGMVRERRKRSVFFVDLWTASWTNLQHVGARGAATRSSGVRDVVYSLVFYVHARTARVNVNIPSELAHTDRGRQWQLTN